MALISKQDGVYCIKETRPIAMRPTDAVTIVWGKPDKTGVRSPVQAIPIAADPHKYWPTPGEAAELKAGRWITTMHPAGLTEDQWLGLRLGGLTLDSKGTLSVALHDDVVKDW